MLLPSFVILRICRAKHQTFWKMKEMALQANLHPDYHRAALGEWPERVSIYHAFIEELQVINDMALRGAKARAEVS